MSSVPLRKFVSGGEGGSSHVRSRVFLHFSFRHQLLLLMMIPCLLAGVLNIVGPIRDVQAANPGVGKACSWYRVVAGDTLGVIALRNRSDIWTLARVNYIPNVNLIFINQRLCIPYTLGNHKAGFTSGLSANGTVRWYAHAALEYSTPQRVATLLRQAAARHGLPAKLLLAIGWQESGWNHHVIARDGGIGAMQIMPYTAQNLNIQVRGHYDPYKLWDNIELGAIYLQTLWRGFSGNITKVISAYNQGGWNVQHRGIYNWPYVNNVLALMKRY